MNTLSRATLGALCAVTVALTLAACSAPAPTPTATNDSGAPSPSASASASAEPAGDSVPYSQDCENLMPSSVVYAWNPNYSLDNNATPATGSSWDIVTTLDGTNCNFVNQSSGNAVSISVAQLTDSGVSVLKEQISADLPSIGTDAQGGEEFFGTIAGAGVYEMFASNKFWITIAGPDIASAADIDALKQQILQYLPWG